MIPLHDDNPTHIRPYVTWAIIGICAVVFLWQFSLGEAGQKAVYALGLIPAVLFGGKSLAPEVALIPALLTPFTSMFLHGGWMHLIGNTGYLWVFGNNIEDAMGHGRFIAFYLLTGLAAAAGQIASDPGSEIPMIGASGAISGVLGAYLLLYPRARVLVLFWFGFFVTTTRVPALIVLGLWIVLQLVSAAMDDGVGGGVAWWAHIGGFVAGVALIPLFKNARVPLFGHGKEGHEKKARGPKFTWRPSLGRGRLPDSGQMRRRAKKPRGPWGSR